MAVVVEGALLYSASLSKGRRAGLVAIPIAIASLAWGGALAVYGELQPVPPPASVASNVDGPAVYARHCAYCHGANGDGNGLAQLDPKARAFGKDKFKFATTANGNPCDDDLLRLLKRGIPGSAMPAFDHLSDTELQAVVEHLRLLTRRGLYAELKRIADASEEDVFDPVKTTKRVAELTAIGKPIETPAFNPATQDSIARGRTIFLGKEAACSSCHGDQGRGDGPQGVARLEKIREKEAKGGKLETDEKDLLREAKGGTLVFPRNLTSGVFKGGRDPAHVYARIKLGIPGVLAMPAAEKLSPDDVRDLVNFVLSLSPQTAEVPRNGITVAGR